MKKIPEFHTDDEAEHFLETADLTEYDLSQFKPANFNFVKKSERLTMDIPAGLLSAVKASAAAQHIPYQQYIHQVLAQSLR